MSYNSKATEVHNGDHLATVQCCVTNSWHLCECQLTQTVHHKHPCSSHHNNNDPSPSRTQGCTHPVQLFVLFISTHATFLFRIVLVVWQCTLSFSGEPCCHKGVCCLRECLGGFYGSNMIHTNVST